MLEGEYQGYGLVVVGHSLGAGVAQLLCMLLSERYPNVQCRAYAAPHVCSKALAQHLGKRNISVVLGDDVIPRLSVRNSELLRDRMIAQAAHCNLPKWRIILGGLTQDW